MQKKMGMSVEKQKSTAGKSSSYSKKERLNLAKKTNAVKQTARIQVSSKTKPFEHWLKKNKYYHNHLLKFYRFVIPKGARVLQVNCKNGYVLAAVEPSVGIGLDDDIASIKTARDKHKQFEFFTEGLESIPQQTFDYIVLTSVTMEEYDIQDLFTKLRRFCTHETRIVVDTYSYLWKPVLWLTQKCGLRRPTRFKNWISQQDLHNFLRLAGFEVVITHRHMLLPMYIPIISALFNSLFIHIPLIRSFCLHEVSVAYPVLPVLNAQDYTISVVVPCRNERGNIEAAVMRCPQMGKETEIIFVEGNSIDGTLDEIKRVVEKYPEKNIKYFVQDGKGKGDAVRKGFANAQGDILMILDADLTVPPEELPKFVDALIQGRGEFINGSRLVYGLETNAMWFLSVFANYFFGVLLSWLIGQRLKDTLCGTKALFKKDYEKIAANRAYFGNFDPFGDFDLLFGAAKLNLKIVDMPVHYKSRTYGTTKINRFIHGWILVGMSFFALKKLKLR